MIALLSLSFAISAPPGVVIAHSPAATKQYIGSPGLAVLPNGEYVASHDFFGPGSSRDTTTVYGSTDKGETWTKRATIKGQWWSSLFVHAGKLYLMGTSKEYGFTVIRRSTDGGRTWTEPKDAQTGLLLGDAKYHCAPVPVVAHNGRLWRAMEEYTGPTWGHFKSFVMSAPAGADLLDAANWTTTNRLDGNRDWLDGKFGGWLEGNVVVTPAGKLVNMLRVEHPDYNEFAATVLISDDGKTGTFDPATGFARFPGGAKKFTIRFDRTSKKYWTLANHVPKEFRVGDLKPARVRNTLWLCSSDDLKTWTIADRPTLHHPDPKNHGFQYVDWLFDGDDLIALVRTAHDEPNGVAHNAHDANYLTFHRVKAFRKER
jgi:hypothetical protein